MDWISVFDNYVFECLLDCSYYYLVEQQNFVFNVDMFIFFISDFDCLDFDIKEFQDDVVNLDFQEFLNILQYECY